MSDYRDMSIGEAIAWGIAPGMCDEPLPSKSERSKRWDRRKARKDERRK